MTNDGKVEKLMLSISNPHCSYCSRVIEQRLKDAPGITDISVSYLTDQVLVRYDATKITPDEIRASVKELGYDTVENNRGVRG
ncbi:MAG TPA: cation transporter [Terriglobales bacterium]|nr:cation transporter [Terriglobales bacterium]